MKLYKHVLIHCRETAQWRHYLIKCPRGIQRPGNFDWRCTIPSNAPGIIFIHDKHNSLMSMNWHDECTWDVSFGRIELINDVLWMTSATSCVAPGRHQRLALSYTWEHVLCGITNAPTAMLKPLEIWVFDRTVITNDTVHAKYLVSPNKGTISLYHNKEWNIILRKSEFSSDVSDFLYHTFCLILQGTEYEIWSSSIPTCPFMPLHDPCYCIFYPFNVTM